MDEGREGFPLTALREIRLLKYLQHDNIVNLKEIVTDGTEENKVHGDRCIYMVLEYMDHDLTGLMDTPGVHFHVEHVKCYMQQLLRGLEFCHGHEVLHRDIKGSNLLLDNHGNLKIADFGLARWNGEPGRAYTNRVITLWYRPPELLLGTNMYGPSVDMWSVGCLLAELLLRRPLFPGRDEAEQVDTIFRLLGAPNETVWPGWSAMPNSELVNAAASAPYSTSRLRARCSSMDSGAVRLVERLLSMDPSRRPSASEALADEWFRTPPLPCTPGQLPRFKQGTHEFQAKQRRQEARAAEDKSGSGRGGSHAPHDGAGSSRPSSRAPGAGGPSGPYVAAIDGQRPPLPTGPPSSKRWPPARPPAPLPPTGAEREKAAAFLAPPRPRVGGVPPGRPKPPRAGVPVAPTAPPPPPYPSAAAARPAAAVAGGDVRRLLLPPRSGSAAASTRPVVVDVVSAMAARRVAPSQSGADGPGGATDKRLPANAAGGGASVAGSDASGVAKAGVKEPPAAPDKAATKPSASAAASPVPRDSTGSLKAGRTVPVADAKQAPQSDGEAGAKTERAKPSDKAADVKAVDKPADKAADVKPQAMKVDAKSDAKVPDAKKRDVKPVAMEIDAKAAAKAEPGGPRHSPSVKAPPLAADALARDGARARDDAPPPAGVKAEPTDEWPDIPPSPPRRSTRPTRSSQRGAPAAPAAPDAPPAAKPTARPPKPAGRPGGKRAATPPPPPPPPPAAAAPPPPSPGGAAG
ncbi:hypothetical protein BU14_1859s0001, partial [Porphyra umbilicalis]